MNNVITLNGVDYVPADSVSTEPSKMQILVLQRGWVIVGESRFLRGEDGLPDEIVVANASVIRNWGTTKGLGELVNGPLPETVLDPAGTVRVHPLAAVLAIDVDTAAWNR